MYQGMFDLTFKHSIFVDILLGISLFLNITEAYSQYNNDLIINATVTIDDFAITRITPDGAIQRRINYQGICAIETIVDWGYELYKFKLIFVYLFRMISIRVSYL